MLLVEVVDVRVEYEEGSRAEAIMTLLLLDLRAAPSHGLVVPFPKHTMLASRCGQFPTSLPGWCSGHMMHLRPVSLARNWIMPVVSRMRIDDYRMRPAYWDVIGREPRKMATLSTDIC